MHIYTRISIDKYIYICTRLSMGLKRDYNIRTFGPMYIRLHLSLWVQMGMDIKRLIYNSLTLEILLM